MAAKKLLEKLTDAKSRTLVLLSAGVIVILIVVSYFIFSKGSSAEKEISQAPKIPDITSIPGQVTSEKYQQLLEQSNVNRAKEAEKKGTSAIATIIGSREKDILAKKESFGIEDEFLKGGGECKCPPIGGEAGKPCSPPIDNITLAKLTKQIEANENDAIRLMKANPCLAARLSQTRPELLKKLMQNPEFAKQFAQLYPDVLKSIMKADPAFAAQMLAKYPSIVTDLMKNDSQFGDALCKNAMDDATVEKLTKQIEADESAAIGIMKANPCLAKRLQETNPALLKKLMQNPAFAKEFAKMYPDVVKNLMANDPDFAKQMYDKYPDMVKDLMKNDNEFAKTIAKNNPAIMKDLMLKDPDFAKLMAKNNPDMVKELMRTDPAFAAALAKANPTLVKELMKNDPAFARQMAQIAPDMMKQLMKDDPDFARAMATASPGMVNDLMKGDPEFAKALLANTPGLNTLLENALPKSSLSTDQARLAALDEERRRRQAQQAEEAKQIQLSDIQQKQIAAVAAGMDSQSKAVFQAWNEIGQQQFVVGEWRTKDEKGNPTAAGGAVILPPGAVPPGEGLPPPVTIKAGTIFYASLDTAINTDEPGPIMATIIAGPYIGAKALGTIQFVQQPGSNRPEKVTLNFTTLSLANQPKSISITGIALDPDTARTALASDVDHHYLLRYGTLFASAFMQGYAKVITSMGTTQTTSLNGLATQTMSPQLSSRQQLFAALGQVGQNFGQAFAGYFNLPNTITVDSGTSIGLLILTDVTG